MNALYIINIIVLVLVGVAGALFVENGNNFLWWIVNLIKLFLSAFWVYYLQVILLKLQTSIPDQVRRDEYVKKIREFYSRKINILFFIWALYSISGAYEIIFGQRPLNFTTIQIVFIFVWPIIVSVFLGRDRLNKSDIG